MRIRIECRIFPSGLKLSVNWSGGQGLEGNELAIIKKMDQKIHEPAIRSGKYFTNPLRCLLAMPL